jgi:hypothetical protein
MKLEIIFGRFDSTICSIGYEQNHVIASNGQYAILSFGINACTIYHINQAKNILAIISMSYICS